MHATFWAVLAFAVAAGQPDSRLPVPSQEAVGKAEESVKELYGDRLAAAKKPKDKAALGRELLKVAGESADDPAAQMVLWEAARDLGAAAKDWGLIRSALAAKVERFKSNVPGTATDLIHYADSLVSQAKKKPAAERLAMRLKAVECYLRAEREGSGLKKQIAEKRIEDIAKTCDGGKPSRDDQELRLLIGTWRFNVGNVRGTWSFSPDGTSRWGDLDNGRFGFGKWTLEDSRIKIVWEGGGV